MGQPVIVWFRRDLRLSDHAALDWAAARGPVLAVFVLEPALAALGAAALWRLQRALEVFAPRLAVLGIPLVLRRGPAETVLPDLARESGAAAIAWSRRYDPQGVATDREVKARLQAAGLQAHSFPGFLLHEPFRLQTAEGRDYRVFTHFWRNLRQRDPGPPLPAPAGLRGATIRLTGDALADWQLGARMGRGADVLADQGLAAGEEAAHARLSAFCQRGLADYPERRDGLAEAGTSALSEHLTWGEIAPRQVWSRVQAALLAGDRGAEPFLRQLAWRDFAWHLFWHRPDLDRENWAPGWQRFAWRAAPDPGLTAWQRAQTGEEVIDAAMRELYATGRMHNRARMLVASYLTKHLLVDWREGLRWFADCLTDFDPAANALGWQWVAGCGPDAAPYFRVFNPRLQADRFDPDGAYRRAWGPASPAFHAAVPRAWGLVPGRGPAAPIVDPAAGRDRALAAHAAMKGNA